ncbi:MAG TPA: protein-L-isoaspartate O-methyltransferase [Candidatus Sabulitectum sp.]|nr:protein-L-isoaspartate O-methyltransferase [Candidatus Sabulitectum sp.]
MASDRWEESRKRMVELLVHRGITDESVLSAMGSVQRHCFLPPGAGRYADPYGDYPMEIGCGQTISQPYIVAYMLQKLRLSMGDRVLDIGTGSGYQAAVLYEMGMEVFSMESVPNLYSQAREKLPSGLRMKMGDGYLGWPEEAPFQGIVIACAPLEVPRELVEQVAPGGRMVLPVGGYFQQLVVVKRDNDGVTVSRDLPVRFVPMLRTEH